MRKILFYNKYVNSYKEIFIENLKYYRTECNITQAELAERCDCQPGTIGCIECGRQYPSFEMIIKMSDALKINPADLFLRNASATVSCAKRILRTELIPQIEEFIERRM